MRMERTLFLPTMEKNAKRSVGNLKKRKKQPWSNSLRFIVYEGKAETIAVFG